MFKLSVKLNEVDKIQKFYEVVTKTDYDIDLVRGRYIVDAKSVLGIYSLDLSKPVDVVLHCDDEKEFHKFVTELKRASVEVIG